MKQYNRANYDNKDNVNNKNIYTYIHTLNGSKKCSANYISIRFCFVDISLTYSPAARPGPVPGVSSWARPTDVSSTGNVLALHALEARTVSTADWGTTVTSTVTWKRNDQCNEL